MVKVALILGRWIVNLHRFGSFFLCDVRGTGELCVQSLLQSLDQFRLLLLKISLVGVAYEVDVLAHLACLFTVFLGR